MVFAARLTHRLCIILLFLVSITTCLVGTGFGMHYAFQLVANAIVCGLSKILTYIQAHWNFNVTMIRFCQKNVKTEIHNLRFLLILKFRVIQTKLYNFPPQEPLTHYFVMVKSS